MQPTEPRKSSSKLWPIVIAIFVFLVLAGGAGLYFGGKYLGGFISQTQVRAEQRAAKMKDLEAQRREMQRALKDSLDQKTPSDGMADRLAKFGKSAGEAAELMSGSQKKAMLVSQRIVAGMTVPLGQYEKAMQELHNANVLSPNGLDSRDAIAARVAVVKKFGEANDTFKGVVVGMESRVRDELNKEELSDKDRDEFVKGFVRSANVDLNRTIRDCDTELVDAMLQILAILDRDWGTWKNQDGRFAFSKRESAEEFNKLTVSLNDIAKRQADAQQALIRARAAAAATR